MNDLYTSRLAQTINQDRLDEAAKARRWATRATPAHPLDQFRMALSARLIAWGQQLQVPSSPAKAR